MRSIRKLASCIATQTSPLAWQRPSTAPPWSTAISQQSPGPSIARTAAPARCILAAPALAAAAPVHRDAIKLGVVCRKCCDWTHTCSTCRTDKQTDHGRMDIQPLPARANSPGCNAERPGSRRRSSAAPRPSRWGCCCLAAPCRSASCPPRESPSGRATRSWESVCPAWHGIIEMISRRR